MLERARSIAVLGASSRPERAGHYVGAYLVSVGYSVWPINPVRAGASIWGREVLGTLADLPAPVDLIDVFRRPDLLPGHVDEILGMPTLPSVVWLQLGIWHPCVHRLDEAGVDVVRNRCTYADHQRLGLAPIR